MLAPFFVFEEEPEEQPSFSVIVFDKINDPGSDLLVETVRNAIWAINPMAWQGLPFTEPDVTIHLELLGTKIILSAMPHFMK